MHRIVLTPSGALSFPHHSKGFATERVLTGLTGKQCRCLEIFNAWRECWNASRILPEPLLAEHKKGRKLRFARRPLTVGETDPLLKNLNKRMDERIVALARATLAKCNYKHFVSVDMNIGPDICTWDVPLSTGGTGSRIYITRKWYKTVYRRGLAVIDGMFVLCAGSTFANNNIPVVVHCQNERSRSDAIQAIAVYKNGTYQLETV